MTVDLLPVHMREFAHYLGALLTRLDPGGGWCGAFWRRDPEGMRACLDGREVPPWDVVEALLQDLAARLGPAVAASEHQRARALHTAATTAYDARPGAREVLGERLELMRRERRYAAGRRARLGRRLAAAPTAEEADALRADLAWAHDDHERALARCAELRARIAVLDHGAATEDAPAHLSVPHPAAPGWATAPAPGPGPAPGAGPGAAAGAVPGPGAGPGSGPAPGRAPGAVPGSASGPVPGAAPGPLPYPGGGPYPGEDPHLAGDPHPGGDPHLAGDPHPGGDPRAVRGHTGPTAAGTGGKGPGNAGTGDVAAGHAGAGETGTGGAGARTPSVPPSPPAPASPAAPTPAPTTVPEHEHEQGHGHGHGHGHGQEPPAAPTPTPTRGPGPESQSPFASDPDPAAPAAAPAPRTAPGSRTRKRRRGSARFAGVEPEEAGPAAGPVLVPPGVAPPAAAAAPPPGGRSAPRGARFAGAVTEAGQGPVAAPGAGGGPRAGTGAPGAVEEDPEAGPAVARAVAALARLRREGRSGEAHALLAGAAQWPPARLPALADGLERAGLAADWTTLLWEAASLPAGRLVAAADALAAAGRPDDGERIVRQGVLRPAAEVGEGVLALLAEERHREARIVLDACVRARTPEQAARSAGPDPGRLVPLLLRAARDVSDERHWDLLHALRVAGIPT
ncbi:hypothetical protein [Streptomyces sp. NPDC004065]|uniref:hypothetical protein n=1 Tax=Streptomyces sp. NPDC004065 TaxID=3364689 RepID=UPI0038502920